MEEAVENEEEVAIPPITSDQFGVVAQQFVVEGNSTGTAEEVGLDGDDFMLAEQDVVNQGGVIIPEQSNEASQQMNTLSPQQIPEENCIPLIQYYYSLLQRHMVPNIRNIISQQINALNPERQRNMAAQLQNMIQPPFMLAQEQEMPTQQEALDLSAKTRKF